MYLWCTLRARFLFTTPGDANLHLRIFFFSLPFNFYCLTKRLEISGSRRSVARRRDPYPNCGVVRCSTSMKWLDSMRRLDPNSNKADGNIEIRKQAAQGNFTNGCTNTECLLTEQKHCAITLYTYNCKI